MFYNWKMPLLVAAITLGGAISTPALADCCGPPPSAPDQFQLGPGWSGTVLFEHMDMTTLIKGSEEVTPDQVLAERLNAGAASYSVPTKMYMDRASIQLRYKFDDNHALRVAVPWRANQMDMRMAKKMTGPMAGGGGMGGAGHAMHQQMPTSNQDMGGMGNMGDANAMPAGGQDMAGMGNMGDANAMPAGGQDMAGMGNMGDANAMPAAGQEMAGMGTMGDANGMTDMGAMGAMGNMAAMPPMIMDHTMDPLSGLGDVIVNYTYSFDLDGVQAWVGAGVQIPTGEWDARSDNGQLIHSMMQPGSGSIGLLGEAAADIPLGDSKFSIHPRMGIQWNGTNPLGYQRGARFDYEIGTRYDIIEQVGLSLDFVGFVMGKDSTNGTIDSQTGQVAFQRPETSLVDNVENTGGHFMFIAPGIRVKPTENIFLGFQYRLPVSQNVNGTQLGIDGWYRGFLSARF